MRRHLLISVLAVAAMALSPAGLAAASAESAADSPAEALEPLADLVAQRIEIADTVAAAKFGTTSPIEDPAREEVVLETAATKAVEQGLDPDQVRAVFRDQIQASKVVQYGIYSRWTAYPDEVPTTRPDLAQVRPVLDGITDGIVQQLAATRDVRSSESCDDELRAAEKHMSDARDFDTLHIDAFQRALVSICT